MKKNKFLNIITLGIWAIYEKPRRFHKIISEFRDKLDNYQEVKVTEAEIEKFFEELNEIDFSASIFPEYYRNYINNVNRFKPEGEDLILELSLLKVAIAEEKWRPTEPGPVFKYHMQYRNRLTSKAFISYEKKQNRKKIDTTSKIKKKEDASKSEKQWTRVPLSRDKCNNKGCNCSK